MGLSKKHKKNYMRVATLIGGFSYCNKKQVGSVLVKKNQIIATGYNGTISGSNNVCEINGSTKNNVLHSEANCILSCTKRGVSTNNCILFVTLSPCINCAKLIIQAGIKKVYYLEEYKDLSGIELLKGLIKVKKLNI